MVVSLQMNETINLNPQLYIVRYKSGLDYCSSVCIYFVSSPGIISTIFPVWDSRDVQVW